ncbi:MAG: DUF2330 domain-containing protein [Candidatus Promineifilaceae bacterium]
MRRKVLLCLVLVGVIGCAWLSSQTAEACGGLFCQNNPVDQNAERIIFTQNGDGTVSAIIQIQYTGFDDDFSWILPLSTPITAEDIEVPETGTTAFVELEQMTNVRFIPPPVPDDCLVVEFEAVEESAEAGGVEVFATGEVGPFGFDVIGSDDPTALINWLRDNNYRVEEQMEPLINLYVEENFYFLAMRLLPDQGVQDIQPIKVTYDSDVPMIPLRLTAVAANPDMAVLVWFFAEQQAVPLNYTHIQIPTDDLRFYIYGGNNYRQLIGTTADRFQGQAFVTEYAGSSSNFAFTDPLLVELAQEHSYLTRLNTVISPEEMTVDPVFGYDPGQPDVSNVRDLSSYDKDLYECDRVESSNTENEGGSTINLPFFGNSGDDNNSNSAVSPTETAPQSNNDSSNSGVFRTGIIVGVLLGIVAGAFVVIGAGIWLIRRSGK